MHQDLTSPASIEEFNSFDSAQLITILADIYGSTPLAERVIAARPFRSVAAACEFAADTLDHLDEALVLESINAHPAIGGKVTPGSLSEGEQSTAANSTAETMAAIAEKSQAYQERFGFNFLIKAAGRSGAEILANLTKRLDNDPETEKLVARHHLAGINTLRLANMLFQPVSLSTHVLDTASGLPAADVAVALFSLDVATTAGPSTAASAEFVATSLATAHTDNDGRHRFDLHLEVGTYRLRFATGEYFAAQHTDTLYPMAEITFSVSPTSPGHLHVPLLLAPYGFSTYRGS